MAVEVLIVLGSKTDAEVGKKAASILDEFGVEHEMVVASAHRTPDLLRDLIRNTPAKIFIAIAGLSAVLPVEILALNDERLAGKLKDHRDAMKKWVLEDSRTLAK